jgi:F420-0:gamma-glutamyl ligase-like protein
MGWTRITGRLRNMRTRYMSNFRKYAKENAQVEDDMKGFKVIGKLLVPKGHVDDA